MSEEDRKYRAGTTTYRICKEPKGTEKVNGLMSGQPMNLVDVRRIRTDRIVTEEVYQLLTLTIP